MEEQKEWIKNVLLDIFGSGMADALTADGESPENMGSIDAVVDRFIHRYSVRIGSADAMAAIVELYIRENVEKRMEYFKDVEPKKARDFAKWSIERCLLHDTQTMNSGEFFTTIADVLHDENKRFYWWRGDTNTTDYAIVFVDWGDTEYWFDEHDSRLTPIHTIIAKGIARYQSIGNDKDKEDRK